MAASLDYVRETQDEEAPLVVEPSAKSRSIWRIVAAASVSAALVVAGTMWVSGRVMTEGGEDTTGLQTTTVKYGAVASLGCTNWADITLSRTKGISKEECEALCTASAECTMANYQLAACPPPEGSSDAMDCLLFKGECAPTANKCWNMNYKFTEVTP